METKTWSSTPRIDVDICPLCGGAPQMKSAYLWSTVGWGKSYTSYHVECDRCGFTGGYFNTIDHGQAADILAANDWNDRIGKMHSHRADCPMRHESGNCMPAGGFCTAVNDPICDALQNAYRQGHFDCAVELVQKRQAEEDLGLWQ